MAQRSPPAALLELQQNFPAMSTTAFDGNWTSYELRFLTAISRLPAVVGLVSGQFLRPTQEDAAAFIFPNVNGLSELPKFKRRQLFCSTGCLALSCGVNSLKYGTAVSVGEFNSPWQGDTFDLATGKAGYAALVSEARAAYQGADDHFVAPLTLDQYLVREIGMRIEFERAQVLTLRQQEWDAANSYLFGALLGSIRDLDHAIIRAHQGDGALAWRAPRAVYAGADC